MKVRKLRVLAISPRFAPSNSPEMHRLRLLIKHADNNGWTTEILAVDPDDLIAVQDGWLTKQLPMNIVISHVRISGFLRRFFGNLGITALFSLYKSGCKKLADDKFDLVFFSTTEFLVHLLGPLWGKKFNIPFCMDYQDPWVTSYYDEHPEISRPGGNLKYYLASRLHMLAEKYVVPRCSGFLSVSERYLEDLDVRYGVNISNIPRLVRPFPAEPAERWSETDNPDSHFSWRYIGAGGEIFKKSSGAFFSAWEHALDLGVVHQNEITFEALGTSYSVNGKLPAHFLDQVKNSPLYSSVKESPERLPYSEVLKILAKSSALIVFGTDDPGYTASKIYAYLLAKRPLLAIFHERSSVVPLMREVGGGILVTFNDQTSMSELSAKIFRQWFSNKQYSTCVTLDMDALLPYTANVQAGEIGSWFHDVLRFYAGSKQQST